METDFMCLHPYHVKKNGEWLEVPCSRCLGCRISYQREISFLAECEKQWCYDKGLGNSFCTLTYNDDCVPVVYDDIDQRGRMTLRRSDFQKFLKRFRERLRYYDYPKVFLRFIGCGEYGDGSHKANGIPSDRPHYHFVMFGISKDLSEKIIYDCWKFGFPQVGDLRSGGIRYVSDYITKSKMSKCNNFWVYTTTNREPPFFRRSSYLGREWIEKHLAGNSCFYRGELLPKVVRDWLGLDAYDLIRDTTKQALSYGFKTVKDYQDYMRDNFKKRIVTEYRHKNIPLDMSEL